MSDKAWARYKPEDGSILGITWQRPDGGDFIEITGQMARDFMLGQLRTVAFAVKKETLESIELFEGYQQFWNLLPLHNDPAGNMSVGDDHVLLRCMDGDRLPSVLFATLDGNPSWIVGSWKIDWSEHGTSRESRVDVDRAGSYSYYCWVPG